MRGIMYREFATVLIREARYAEAEQQLDHAWSVFSTAEGFGPLHPRAQDVVATYIDLYNAWGKPDSEAVWRVKKKPEAEVK